MKDFNYPVLDHLKKGLATRYNHRNAPFLVESYGAFPYENKLRSLDLFSIINPFIVGPFTFPYPQLFVYSDCIIFCTSTEIYEYTPPVTEQVSLVLPKTYAIGFDSVKKLTAIQVVFSLSGTPIRYTIDGTLPTISTGTLVQNGQTVIIGGNAYVQSFLAMQTNPAGRSVLYCTYCYSYESFDLKVDEIPEYSTWEAVDFKTYIYLSNGKMVVTKSATTGLYSRKFGRDSLPAALSVCNYQGQVLLGSPINYPFHTIITPSAIIIVLSLATTTTSSSFPLSGYSTLGVDPGSFLLAATRRNDVGILLFVQHGDTFSMAGIDYINSLPQTFDAVAFDHMFEYMPCPRNETDFQMVGFKMQSSDDLGLFIETYEDGTRAGPYLIAKIEDTDTAFSAKEGQWIECGPGGVGIIATYVRRTVVDTATTNRIQISTSVDQGATWKESTISLNDGTVFYQAAPSFSIGQDGNFYIATHYPLISGESSDIYVFISSDRGSTWQAKKIATETDTIDDFSVCASSDTIYVAVATKNSGAGTHKVTIYSSEDDGATWDTAVRNELADYAAISCNLGSLVVASNYKYAGFDVPVICRTTNKGGTFTDIEYLTQYGLTTAAVPFIRSQGSTFVWSTYLFNYYNAICYLLSEDDGVTWTAKDSHLNYAPETIEILNNIITVDVSPAFTFYVVENVTIAASPIVISSSISASFNFGNNVSITADPIIIDSSLAATFTAESVYNGGLLSDRDVVALWNMETSALTVDSKSTNTLTDVNSVSSDATYEHQGSSCLVTTRATNNKYLKLVTADKSADFPLQAADTTKLISVCGWVRLPSVTLAGGQQLFGTCGYSYNQYRGAGIYISSNGSLILQFGNGTDSPGSLQDHDTGFDLAADRNYHIALVVDGVNKTWKVRVYDETNNTSTTYTDTHSGGAMVCDGSDFRIGMWPNYNIGNTGTTAYFDEVVVFKRWLSDAHIDDIKNGVF